jgi:hypothetical protein
MVLIHFIAVCSFVKDSTYAGLWENRSYADMLSFVFRNDTKDDVFVHQVSGFILLVLLWNFKGSVLLYLGDRIRIAVVLCPVY